MLVIQNANVEKMFISKDGTISMNSIPSDMYHTNSWAREKGPVLLTMVTVSPEISTHNRTAEAQ